MGLAEPGVKGKMPIPTGGISRNLIGRGFASTIISDFRGTEWCRFAGATGMNAETQMCDEAAAPKPTC